MRTESIEIVNFKCTLELNITSSLKKPVLIWPDDFGKVMLPFWTDEILTSCKNCSVNPFEVVGIDIGNHAQENQTVQQCQILNNSARARLRPPSYHKVGDFPLYIAGEGKNRVSLFQKNQKDIIADIKFTPYPKANTLKIHKVFGRRLYFVSCTDRKFNPSNKFIQVAFPKLTLPLLRAYNVKDGQCIIRPFACSIEKKAIRNLYNQ